MEAIILTKPQYDNLLNIIEEIKSALEKNPITPKKNFLDNKEFIELMNISKRTAQTWRDQGVIAFSQIGSKIYYQFGDIKKLLDKNHQTSFKNFNC